VSEQVGVTTCPLRESPSQVETAGSPATEKLSCIWAMAVLPKNTIQRVHFHDADAADAHRVAK
jgi:hypothetical protein